MAFPPVPFQEWFLRQTSTGNAALNAYVARVKADGGVVEAIGCVPLAVWDWVAPVAPSFVGLLDLYPNAAAAYSLRKLRAAYSGSAVRVRKEVSSVSSETDIGFAADGSLDTVSLLAFASDADSGDVFVVTWYDQSLSNDATQSTGAKQPKIVSGGSLVTENGKPAIDFDGVNDDLTLSSEILTDTHYMSMVAANTTKGRILGDNASYNYFLESGATNNRYRINGIIYNLGTRIFQTQKLVTWSRITTSSEFFQNAISINSATVVADDYKFKVIASSFNQVHSDGLIQEIIIYTSDQSSNRAGIETNINTFYSIYS